MRPIVPVVLLAAAILPSAASADVTPANVASLVQRWSLNSGGVSGGPIVRDGRVYIGTWTARVYALDPATGTEIWRRQVGGGIPGRVLATDDGGVCYGTISGEVGCLDGATGAVRWTMSLAEPAPGSIWSAPFAANGRLLVGVASPNDMPCTRGRLVALDLADGHELWRFYTVPDKVCTTDTAIECTLDAECPNSGTCIKGIGGGVTATPTTDPTGEWVYMNTVGCYTFPSIGESDSVFKIRASDGHVEWRHRVNDPEQFSACESTGADCRDSTDCGGGACTEKAAWHDFGFLNGPLRIEVPDGNGTKVLIVSGSKNGTLYAFDEATGDYVWTNVVRATPISPGFAGFGLFNGAITHADGKIFAALYYLLPARVCSNDARQQCNDDADCPGGTCPAEPKHLMAFDAKTGMILWQEEIGRSWSHVAVANGIVYAGTESNDPDTDDSWLYAHDAATGARLATFSLPTNSAARAAITADSVYVGYGVGGGGIVAFSLCPNGTVDPGESCDGGTPSTNPCCTAACTFQASGQTCDDTDACTSGDQCSEGSCAGAVSTVEQIGCSLDAFETSPCGGESLPAALTKAIARATQRIERLFSKAMTLVAKGKTERAERLRTKAQKSLDGIATKASKAADARKESKRITAECHAALDALVASRRTVLANFAF